MFRFTHVHTATFGERDWLARYDPGVCGVIWKLCAGVGLRGPARMFLERWPYRHAMPVTPARVRELADQCGMAAWYIHALNTRARRRHVCIACGWQADNFPRGISIFEPGCGCGANLLWLASRGFRTISGADLDGAALNLCRALQKEMGLSFPVFQDDCMSPTQPAQPQDVILSVDRLYHVPQASLGVFLETYLPYLKHDGCTVTPMSNIRDVGYRGYLAGYSRT